MTEHRKRMHRTCSWCGKDVDGETYIIQGGKTFCSRKCWEQWHNAEQGWENEGGNLDPGMSVPRLFDRDRGMEVRRDHDDPGMEHRRG